MTFDDVPEGQHPTRITPTATIPSRRNTQHRNTASSGMIT